MYKLVHGSLHCTVLLPHTILDMDLYTSLSCTPCYLDTQREQRIRVYSLAGYQRMMISTNKKVSFRVLHTENKDHKVKVSKDLQLVLVYLEVYLKYNVSNVISN